MIKTFSEEEIRQAVRDFSLEKKKEFLQSLGISMDREEEYLIITKMKLRAKDTSFTLLEEWENDVWAYVLKKALTTYWKTGLDCVDPSSIKVEVIKIL